MAKEGSRKRKNLRPLLFFILLILGLFLIYLFHNNDLKILGMIFLCSWSSILLYLGIHNTKTRHSQKSD